MKKLSVVLLICSALLFSACSSDKETEPTDSTRTKLTTSSSTKKKETISLDSILNKFKDDGLAVEDAKDMTKEDFGMAPMSAKEAKIFGIQKDDSGEYMNARIFLFEKEEDLKKTKDYYDDLGKESAMAFSYTAANENKLVLMQFNGDLPQDLVQKYADSADLKLTSTNFVSSTDSISSTAEQNSSNSTNNDTSTQTSVSQGLGYGDHNANIRDARYQEAIEKGATEQEAADFANGSEPTYVPKTPEPVADTQGSSAQQDADALSLTDFLNKYGMSPVAWKVQNGMSEEEALRTTTHRTSGEVQLGISKYGIMP